MHNLKIKEFLNIFQVGRRQRSARVGEAGSTTSYLGPQFISHNSLNVVVNTRGHSSAYNRDVTRISSPQRVHKMHMHQTRTTPCKLRRNWFYLQGSVNTPQLLQPSGIGDRNLLSIAAHLDCKAWNALTLITSILKGLLSWAVSIMVSFAVIRGEQEQVDPILWCHDGPSCLRLSQPHLTLKTV